MATIMSAPAGGRGSDAEIERESPTRVQEILS